MHANTAAGAMREMWVDISLWFATRFSAGLVILFTFVVLGNFFGWCMLWVMRIINILRMKWWSWKHEPGDPTKRNRHSNEFSTIMEWGGKGEMSGSCAHIVAQCFKIMFYMIGVIVALNYWGLPIAPLILSAGILGFCVSIALKDPLSGLFSGIVIMIYDRLHDDTIVKINAPGTVPDAWYKILNISLSKVEMVRETGTNSYDMASRLYMPPAVFTSTPYEVRLQPSSSSYTSFNAYTESHVASAATTTAALRARAPNPLNL